MKRITLLFSALILTTLSVTLTSCSPDYVEDGGTNAASGSVVNFTSGQFTGTLTGTDLGIAGATKNVRGSEIVYLLVSGSGSYQVNSTIQDKASGVISGDNDIMIRRDNKVYFSKSGTFNITQEQVMATQPMGETTTSVIKCKFIFSGKFDVKDFSTDETLDSNVDVNGILFY